MLIENRVMAVDDDATNLAIIRETIGAKCNLQIAFDGETAVRLARDFRPNLVLLDIMMPVMDGYEVCRRIRQDLNARHCRIILISAKTNVADRLKGYEVGADDYLTKPFVDDELEAKVRVALKTKSVDEFAIVREQVERMCGLYGESLAVISQLRDAENGDHLVNVRGVSHILAAELRQGVYASQIDDAFLDRLYVASVLHDVGNIALPDQILHRQDQQTAEEVEQQRKHTIVGERILNHLSRQHSKADVYEMAAAVARWHHEAFDGSGYPDGIRGLRIPLAARIVKVADEFDTRLRRLPSVSLENVTTIKDEIVRCAGVTFDPVVVESLVSTFDEIAALYTDDMFAEKLELSA